MSKQYSRRTFFRQTPNNLLKQYFEQRRIAMPITWEATWEAGAEPLHAALEALPPDVLRAVDGDFSLITELASPKGSRAILEDASLWNQDWSERFASMANDYERAMWTFLNEPRRFEAAGAFHQMDRLTFGWHRFVGYRLDAQTDAGALDAFADALKSHYRSQGRGRNCSIDVYHRLDPERYCYFAYPEDSTSTDLVYDQHNHLVRRPRQSVFEVIFVYRPEEGTVELYAHGDKHEKENLAAVFCTQLLGLSTLPDDDAEPFDLSCLKDPTFAFPTDPQDGVQSVDVPLLRLDLPFDRRNGAGRRITIEAKSTPEAPQAVHGLIRDALDPHQVTARDALVGRAKLRFTFRPVDGRRPKTLTFEVSYPDRCTLKDDPHDQIARKCLYEWGIAPRQRAAVAAAAV